MTQKEFAKHLGEIIHEEVDIEAEDLRYQFYGYFQCFMPSGKGVDKVFEPIDKGTEYFERIIQIYQASEDKFMELSKSNQTPGYFCPSPISAEESLILRGEEYVSNLKKFSLITGDDEFVKVLAEITTIEINDSNVRNNENDTHTIVYEAISDWFIDHTDLESNLEVLSEAFYSVNCDYNLSYYFQYPSYADKLKIDLFEPYFVIWKSGYYCWFEEGKLVIGK